MSEEIKRFIEAWGSMGVFWGINRSMARIHALILVSEKPIDLDHISKSLNISRGNASMSLRELRNWGVIQRVHVSGDRRDFYTAEQDPWKMFYCIAVERKKREFDPMINALRHLLAEANIEKYEKVNERLIQLEELLTIFDSIISKAIESEKKSKIMFEFLKNFTPK